MFPRKVLSPVEQQPYQRLIRAFPDHFVLCTKDFRIAAVLELDDRSHDNPSRMDADRRKAAICDAAGIALHRLNVNPLPNESELRSLLTPDSPVLLAVRN